MEQKQPHALAITHIPLDGPGFRIAGSIDGQDVNLGELREVLEDIEGDLKLTDAALRDPALHDLAKSVRGAHLAIQRIAFHLAELHLGIHDGALNYAEPAHVAYPGS